MSLWLPRVLLAETDGTRIMDIKGNPLSGLQRMDLRENAPVYGFHPFSGQAPCCGKTVLIRPGEDGALALMHVLAREGLCGPRQVSDWFRENDDCQSRAGGCILFHFQVHTVIVYKPNVHYKEVSING